MVWVDLKITTKDIPTKNITYTRESLIRRADYISKVPPEVIQSGDSLRIGIRGESDLSLIREVFSQSGILALAACVSHTTSISSLITLNDTLFRQVQPINPTNSLNDPLSEIELFKHENPLFGILRPVSDYNSFPQNTPLVGFAQVKDTAQVNQYLREYAGLIPEHHHFVWKPMSDYFQQEDSMCELICIDLTETHFANPWLESVYGERSAYTGEPVINISMNEEGTAKWADLTKKSVDKHIAIILDDEVYSYPRVMTPILEGDTQISGGFTGGVEETYPLVFTLLGGPLTAPVEILDIRIDPNSQSSP